MYGGGDGRGGDGEVVIGVIWEVIVKRVNGSVKGDKDKRRF